MAGIIAAVIMKTIERFEAGVPTSTTTALEAGRVGVCQKNCHFQSNKTASEDTPRIFARPLPPYNHPQYTLDRVCDCRR